MSQRRASKLVAIQRSTLFYKPHNKDESAIRCRMRELAAQFTRWGCPLIHRVLRREGLVVNHKRTERIYREEKLSLKVRRRKKRPTLRIEMPKTDRANQHWAMDFIHDQLMNGRRVKALTLIDEYTRESLAIEVDTSLSGRRVVQVLQRVIELRGCPDVIRSDNGPEFTSAALFEWVQEVPVRHFLIEPGKPTQNSFIESFHSRFRDEFLNENGFTTLQEMRELTKKWQTIYNEVRPHSSLDGLTPREFARLQSNDVGCDGEGQRRKALKTQLMTGT